MVLRIFKMIATSGFLTALECTNICPGPPWDRLQCSSDILAGLRSPTSKGRERVVEGKGREKGKRGTPTPSQFLVSARDSCWMVNCSVG